MILSQEVGSGERFVLRFFVSNVGKLGRCLRNYQAYAGIKRRGFYAFTAPTSCRRRGRKIAIIGAMVMRSFLNSGASFYIDSSDLEEKIDLLRGILTPNEFKKLIYRTFNEVGRKSKTLISKAVYPDYHVTQRWVRNQIGHFNLTFGGSSPVTCTIPISSAKGVYGDRFKAYALKSGVSVDVVKTGRSRLPKVMKNQGGNPPFIAGGSGNGIVFTRRTKSRLPIVRVVGLGVPQMPLNRSEDAVSSDLLEYAGQRLEHNFIYMLGNGGKV